nr:hypothetical protein [Glycomyces tenuis]
MDDGLIIDDEVQRGAELIVSERTTPWETGTNLYAARIVSEERDTMPCWNSSRLRAATNPLQSQPSISSRPA